MSSGAIPMKTASDAQAAKSTKVKVEAVVNPETGKASTRYAAFSEVKWGPTVLMYLNAIKENVDNIAMKDIMDQSQRYARAVEREEDDATVPETDLDDERAHLAEGSSESEDEPEDMAYD